jgi:alpha-D-ribose 1-methylphosphonate 5-phosphate C-P lyase
VKAQGGFYGNALQAAAITGNQDVAKLLHDQGPDVNAKAVNMEMLSKPQHNVETRMLSSYSLTGSAT